MLKKNEPSSQEKTWRNVKCILLSERSQSEKPIILYDSNYRIFWKRQTMKIVKRSGVEGKEG